jgi:hypothetical protein
LVVDSAGLSAAYAIPPKLIGFAQGVLLMLSIGNGINMP